MLVLSRQQEEVVLIGDNVRVKVVDIRGDKVRLGFEAPPEIKIHREEVYLKIKAQERAEQQPLCQKEEHRNPYDLSTCLGWKAHPNYGGPKAR